MRKVPCPDAIEAEVNASSGKLGESELKSVINVIIADHQAIFRAGIAKALAVGEDIRIVGQPRSSGQLLNALKRLRARVLILSTSLLPLLPEIHAIEGGRNVALLMLVENSETASDFMRPGVQGAIYRCASADVLVEAVRQVSRGEPFLQSRNIDAEVCEDLVGARVRDRLADRELHIISAVVQGFKSRDIATQLCTSEQMIKNTLRKIFDMVGVSDRLELVLFTIHHRILAEATLSVPALAQRADGRYGDTMTMIATRRVTSSVRAIPFPAFAR